MVNSVKSTDLFLSINPFLASQHLGEAHITVVTPPEFNVLKEAGITLDELNAIALDMDIQSLSFVLICLGREKVTKDGKDYIVYQGIVDAPSLTNIRNAIFRRYASKGGNTALFDPQASERRCLGNNAMLIFSFLH